MRLHRLAPDRDDFREQAQLSFHVQALAVTALVIGAEALVARRLVDADWVAEQRTRWFGGATLGPTGGRHLAGVAKYSGIARRHASVRSVWFVNSLRGSLALAAAVLVADLSSVQHGFWVVFGTLSVLRTNAASTGSTALRALLGTAVGFVIGGALIVAIGTDTSALWVALPIALAVAAYSPGTAPFAVGQAAFTVVIAVLFNLIVPVGWRVGVVRIEDVALGCAVSIVVGTLFWPRGVSSVVGDDLADAYRAGASYLTQAVARVSGMLEGGPVDGMAAVTAGLRLDDALRGFTAEQGTKRLSREELWRLVGGSLRLRLTAHAVADMPPDNGDDLGPARDLDRPPDRGPRRLVRPPRGAGQQAVRSGDRPARRARIRRLGRGVDALAPCDLAVRAPRPSRRTSRGARAAGGAPGGGSPPALVAVGLATCM